MSEVKTDKLTGTSTAGSILVTGEGNSTTTNLQQGLCKQWIDYGGDISSINDSFNVSSLGDVSTGKGRVNFSNLPSNANYALSNNSQAASTNTGKSITSANGSTSLYDNETYENDSITDSHSVNSLMHGDLA
jgi:hypothetical protein